MNSPIAAEILRLADQFSRASRIEERRPTAGDYERQIEHLLPKHQPAGFEVAIPDSRVCMQTIMALVAEGKLELVLHRHPCYVLAGTNPKNRVR